MSKRIAAIIKIERGIPVPPMRKHGQFSFILKMKKGDSFFLNNKQYDPKKASQAARAYGKSHGFEMVSRTLDDGVRIWRAE